MPGHPFFSGEAAIDDALKRSPAETGFWARCSHPQDIWGAVSTTDTRAKSDNGYGVVLAEPPKGEGGRAIGDETLVAVRVGCAFLSTIAHPTVEVVLDTFIDHDRRYYSEEGFIDRAGNPRLAFVLVENLAQRIPGGSRFRSDQNGYFESEQGG